MKNTDSFVPHAWNLRKAPFLILLVVVLAGCPVRFISNYDEKTDQAVTDLQKKVETFFVTAEGQTDPLECKYENHKVFYREAKVAVSAIELRAKATPDNHITLQHVGLLKDSLKKLEELHKINCLSAAQVAPLRSNFDSTFTAILKFELAKKRGEQ